MANAPVTTKRYLILAVKRNGKEAVIAQVDTHPGAIARAARRKFLENGPYSKIVIKDTEKDEAT